MFLKYEKILSHFSGVVKREKIHWYFFKYMLIPISSHFEFNVCLHILAWNTGEIDFLSNLSLVLSMRAYMQNFNLGWANFEELFPVALYHRDNKLHH